MKIVTIVGARPQFIKAAALSRVIRHEATEIIVHTGQHYDENMSDIFFTELDIPKPDYNLGVGSGSHGKQTGEMLMGIEKVILDEKPDLMLVYGDTNSTLAGALAASKLLIPVAHVEAGLRSFNMNMPEEQNRILTDHLSKYLFCPTDEAVAHLANDGLTKGVYNVGDVMYDALKYYKPIAEKKYSNGWGRDLVTIDGNSLEQLDSWYLMTVHRSENTDDTTKIETIMSAAQQLDAPVLFPIHPRIRTRATEIMMRRGFDNIILIEPVGYLLMLYLTSNAKKVLTDSGGLQKETWMLETPCVTVRNQTEWVETLEGNWNVLSAIDEKIILDNMLNVIPDMSKRSVDPYGDGKASQKITDILLNK